MIKYRRSNWAGGWLLCFVRTSFRTSKPLRFVAISSSSHSAHAQNFPLRKYIVFVFGIRIRRSQSSGPCTHFSSKNADSTTAGPDLLCVYFYNFVVFLFLGRHTQSLSIGHNSTFLSSFESVVLPKYHRQKVHKYITCCQSVHHYTDGSWVK